MPPGLPERGREALTGERRHQAIAALGIMLAAGDGPCEPFLSVEAVASGDDVIAAGLQEDLLVSDEISRPQTMKNVK